ncbi:MAG TPA: GNAT family N-acetyltransferase [Ktedonobacterales bacterium]|jgi:ribosomal protein S18 acetylase RimI-like enzyme|nr:GNAT family N-acetyltransferase [Ktedonobacterales bacterium]
MINLRPMTESDYQRLRAAIFEDYARETASVRSISIEEGRAAASRQFDDLLPEGIASQGHHFWRIADGVAGDVGDLWVFIDRGKQQAFIYFIGIDEPHRGHGYSKAAMLALEAAVKPLGATHIDLNVFGDNTTAIHLYESLGYRPTAMNMRKEI